MSTIITHRQFPGYHKYEMELAGRPLTLEVGKLAELANAAVMVGYGDTRVLVCATASAHPRQLQPPRGPPRREGHPHQPRHRPPHPPPVPL